MLLAMMVHRVQRTIPVRMESAWVSLWCVTSLEPARWVCVTRKKAASIRLRKVSHVRMAMPVLKAILARDWDVLWERRWIARMGIHARWIPVTRKLAV